MSTFGLAEPGRWRNIKLLPGSYRNHQAVLILKLQTHLIIMRNGRWNHVLIAALFAVLGLSEACFASSVCRFKSFPRRHDVGVSRNGHEVRVVSLRTDSLLSCQKTYALNDLVQAPDESEDDQGDEPKEALQESGPTLSVLSFDSLGEAFQAAATPRLRSHAGPPCGPDRPRFLSLCRWLI